MVRSAIDYLFPFGDDAGSESSRASRRIQSEFGVDQAQADDVVSSALNSVSQMQRDEGYGVPTSMDESMAEAFEASDVQRAMDRYEASKNEGYLVRASELISRKTASGVREARAFVSKVLESAASMRSGK